MAELAVRWLDQEGLSGSDLDELRRLAAEFSVVEAGTHAEPEPWPDPGPEAPPGHPGPFLMEVLPGHRAGRGRYWRPGGSGYTDDPGRAGVYAAGSPHLARGLSAGKVRAVPADLVLEHAARSHRALRSRAADPETE